MSSNNIDLEANLEFDSDIKPLIDDKKLEYFASIEAL